MSFQVRVRSTEESVYGCGVSLAFGSFGGVTERLLTDENGNVEFDGYDNGEITVYVDGKDYGRFYYEDGGNITVHLEDDE